MPELPEVEATRRCLARHLEGHTITRATAADDAIIFGGESPAAIRTRLTGRRVDAVGRHGKYLWLRLDRPPHAVLHLGMSGAVFTQEGPAVALKQARPSTGFPPPHTVLVLTSAAGPSVALSDPRRFARLLWRDAPESTAPIADLGPDALCALPPLAEWRKQVGMHRGTIKGLLLNQRKIAGLGNWVADEVLHEAAVHPGHPAATLAPKAVAALHRAIRSVLALAVACQADSHHFPRHWLFHQRWPGTPLPKGLRRDRIAGRTTLWCPERVGAPPSA